MEQPDIEKEVKRLFRTDAEAINVKWEVITEEDKSSNDAGGHSGMEGWTAAGPSGTIQRTDTATSLDYGE